MMNCVKSENVSECTEDCKFDPYWIYALFIPFLGILFNGILLLICISMVYGRFPRRRSTASTTHQMADYTFHSRTGDDPQTVPMVHHNHQPESEPNRRPEFALNSFVSNCSISALFGSCLRTITTSYLFTLNYILCPSSHLNITLSQIMQILLYLQHSIFNVAYVNFLIVLNLDKLLFIMKPLHYRRVMTRKRVIFGSIFTWLLSAAWLPLYFAQNEEEAVRWATILVTILMIGPSIFCLITSAILAVVVFRVQMQDRLHKTFNSNNNNSISYCLTYCGSIFRLFQSVVWTCVTSLPHPLAIIISYYTSVGDLSSNVVLRFFIGYLSIAYFSGTPFMIMWTYPIYWRRFKLYFA